MTDPTGNVRPPRDIEARMAALEARLRAVEQRGATKVGRFSVVDDDGNVSMYAGPDAEFPRPDTHPQWRVQLFRDSGVQFFGTFGDYYDSGATYRQYWYMLDNGGHIVISDDAQAGVGLANPWIPFPMWPKIPMPSAPFAYATVTNDNTHSALQLWEGWLPMITHPKLAVVGVWGVGSGSASPTYTLRVQGDVLDTWTETGLVTSGREVDVSSYVGNQWVQVELLVLASGSGSQIAVQLLGAGQRQS